MAFGISDRSVDELSPLVRMVCQRLGRPSDQPGRRLVPGAGQDLEIGQQLGASRLPDVRRSRR